MNAFSDFEVILKEINEKCGYTWKPIIFNSKNRVLGCKLKELVEEELLNEKILVVVG